MSELWGKIKSIKYWWLGVPVVLVAVVAVLRRLWKKPDPKPAPIPGVKPEEAERLREDINTALERAKEEIEKRAEADRERIRNAMKGGDK